MKNKSEIPEVPLNGTVERKLFDLLYGGITLNHDDDASFLSDEASENLRTGNYPKEGDLH